MAFMLTGLGKLPTSACFALLVWSVVPGFDRVSDWVGLNCEASLSQKHACRSTRGRHRLFVPQARKTDVSSSCSLLPVVRFAPRLSSWFQLLVGAAWCR